MWNGYSLEEKLISVSPFSFVDDGFDGIFVTWARDLCYFVRLNSSCNIVGKQKL